MKEYKAVPGPMTVSVVDGDMQDAMNTFAEIINREAVDGWWYHSMEQLQVDIKSGCKRGCIPAMTPQQKVTCYMLIFVREI